MKHLRPFNEIAHDLEQVEQRLLRYVESDVNMLTKAAAQLLMAGGKRLRPAFVLLTSRIYFSSVSDKVRDLAMALELIHMASLVHDDVVDSSSVRRGLPTVKKTYGNRISVDTGDFLFAKSLILIGEINNPEISRILAEVSIQMCEGEIQQLKAVFDVEQEFTDYYYRIKRKTALLISASCRLSAIACGADRRQAWALGAYGHTLGMAFQIVDDVLDLTASAEKLGKPIAGDLRQGIITLPMISALKTCQDSKLAQLLSKREKTEDEVAAAIELIISSGAIKSSLELAQKYVAKAKKYLGEIPDSAAKNSLEQLADFVTVRKY